MIYAVIDTNVLVSALISKNQQSATAQVLAHMLGKDITPLYDDDIMTEYSDVLRRKKFNLDEDRVNFLLGFITKHGEHSSRTTYPQDMPDEDDRVFYEVSLSRDDSFLVTGNLKHFPRTPKVVTPAEMLDILRDEAK